MLRERGVMSTPQFTLSALAIFAASLPPLAAACGTAATNSPRSEPLADGAPPTPERGGPEASPPAFQGGPIGCAGDGSAVVDGACQGCVDLTLNITFAATSELTLLPTFTLDGEGFIKRDGLLHRVFAMSRWGKGHVVALADTNAAAALFQAGDFRGYLGAKANARVASFGNGYCDPSQGPAPYTFPSWLEYQGQNLPPRYSGHPDLLAADFDAVVLCGFSIPWSTRWAADLEAFAKVYGKGFMAVTEFGGGATGLATAKDFAELNLITELAGLRFEDVQLGGGDNKGDEGLLATTLTCVPDLPFQVK